MVCLGNICRSPLAEVLLQSKVDPEKVQVDSAGTGDYHIDEQPHKDSIAIAKRHNLDITDQRGRQFEPADFDRFDEIYVMDSSNYENVLEHAKTDKQSEKVAMILEQSFPGEHKDVPDPYFGIKDGFKMVYDLLDEATDIIAERLNENA